MVIEMKYNLREFTDDRILIAAHRGSWGANIVPNTCAAFEIALRQGATILEMDLTRSTDGEIFIFHTGTEPRYLGKDIDITKLTAAQIRQLRMVNCDGNETDWRVNSFDDVLEMTKNRCILNLDRSADFFGDVAKVIRRHNMESQILMKSAPTKEAIARIENSEARNCMYIPIFKGNQTGLGSGEEEQPESGGCGNCVRNGRVRADSDRFCRRAACDGVGSLGKFAGLQL